MLGSWQEASLYDGCACPWCAYMNDEGIHFPWRITRSLFWHASYLLIAPFHSIPASNLLTLEFALDVRCNPQLSGVPEAIHFAGEVFGELW